MEAWEMPGFRGREENKEWRKSPGCHRAVTD